MFDRRDFLSVIASLPFARLPELEEACSVVDFGLESNIISSSWAECSCDIPADLLEINRRFEELNGLQVPLNFRIPRRQGEQ